MAEVKLFINLNMTAKQRLILFFIDTQFAEDQYRLIKYLDRSAYKPAELGKNLKPLLEAQFIIVSGYAYNGTEFKYSITEKGKEYLNVNLDKQELDDYANGFSNAEIMIEIMAGLLQKRSGA
jgi:DNA-binding PadR family transcriptional regulator